MFWPITVVPPPGLSSPGSSDTIGSGVGRILALHEGEVVHVKPGAGYRHAEDMRPRSEGNVGRNLVVVVVVLLTLLGRNRRVEFNISFEEVTYETIYDRVQNTESTTTK